MTTPVISFLTMKGGVGKTTLAANLTRALADRTKRKILLIDADAQCNLSQIFLPSDQIESATSQSIFRAFDTGGRLAGPSDLKQTIYPVVPGQETLNGSTIDFIVGSFDTFELNATATTARQNSAAQRFTNFMEVAKREYDLIAIDTNPSATFVTMQALANSNFLVAPITFDAFSLQGIHLVIHHLREKYPWLANPDRVRLVANMVPRNPSETAERRLEREEQKIKEKWAYLARCILLERIYETNLIANRAPGRGFLADHNGVSGGYYDQVVQEFAEVAKVIDVSLANAFPPVRTQAKEAPQRTTWSTFTSYLTGAP